MTDDNDDEYIYADDFFSESPTDPIAQRALAFVVVAKFINEIEDEGLRHLSVIMLKKIIMSIKINSAGIVVPFPQSKN